MSRPQPNHVSIHDGSSVFLTTVECPVYHRFPVGELLAGSRFGREIVVTVEAVAIEGGRQCYHLRDPAGTFMIEPIHAVDRYFRAVQP